MQKTVASKSALNCLHAAFERKIEAYTDSTRLDSFSLENCMSHKHLHMLQTIYHDPVSANIHWREIESLLLHLGATIESAHGARFRVLLNSVETFLHHPHNSSTCTKQEIKQIREFLAHAGVTLSAYEAG
jgi:hypothetical protein